MWRSVCPNMLDTVFAIQHLGKRKLLMKPKVCPPPQYGILPGCGNIMQYDCLNLASST